PHRREPRLLVAALAGRTIVVRELLEALPPHDSAPRLPIVEAAVPIAAPSFFVQPTRVRREEDAARHERIAQLPEDARERGAGHVEERRVREDPMKAR